MPRRRLLELTAALIMASRITTTDALFASQREGTLNGLLPRDGQCSNSTYTACNKGSLPSNICCPSSDSCYIFNSGRSVICCPAGKDCSTISTIDCSLDWQDVTKNPTSPMFTTQLNTPMQSCGDKCCPNGMTCKGNNLCVVDPTLLSSSAASSPTSSATASSSSSSSAATATSSTALPTTTTESSTPTPTATDASSSQGAAIAPQKCNQFPMTGLLVGFFSGLTAGIILASLLLCCCSRNRSSKSTRSSKRPHSDFSSVTANVSDPIYQPGISDRTDFLRRESDSRYAHSPAPRLSRMRSLFTRRTPNPNSHSRHSPGLTQNPVKRSRANTATTMASSTPHTNRSRSSTLLTAHNAISRAEGSNTPIPQPPHTPSSSTRRVKKEPSMESIKIYSPPNGIGLELPRMRFGEGPGGERTTTFQEMMAEAGLKEGERYLGSPGRVDPRTRSMNVGQL